ncbi:MAG: hypothetical protein OCD02_14840 [Spirochaetaceae bacterium]
MLNEYKCSVRKHSKKQLEIKVEYPLIEDEKISNFSLELYYFFPSQLHVNEKRIGLKNFLNSMLINTRFSSPLIRLENVLDLDYDLSPLIRIEKLLNDHDLGNSKIHNKLLYELQTLCNLYRTEITNLVKLIKREIKKGQREDIYLERIVLMIKTVKIFLVRFRNLHMLFLNHHIHEDLRTALLWADESISIITGRCFINLFDSCESHLDEYKFRDKIKNVIEKEVTYRKSMNFRYQYDKNNPLCGETMAYRDSVLKKWYQSSMYMNNENSNTPKRIGHIMAGIAAGVAMALTVFIVMFAESYFPKNSSLLIMAIVLSYILKDRIKEILRTAFGNMLPRLTTDQQSNLFDPALKSKVGRSSGAVSFVSSATIPEVVNKIRYKQPNPFRKILPENDIFHYKRRIKIKSGILKKNHSRLESITEIIRFQIDDWLKDMDDSKADLWYLEDDKRIKINGGRVYRVHLIVALNTDKFYHYKLIINRSGILRILKEDV